MGLLDRIRGREDGEIDATIDMRTDEPVIDLRDEPATSPTALGSPGSCPECSGPGYLDRIDVRRSVQMQHCTACRHEWAISID